MTEYQPCESCERELYINGLRIEAWLDRAARRISDYHAESAAICQDGLDDTRRWDARDRRWYANGLHVLGCNHIGLRPLAAPLTTPDGPDVELSADASRLLPGQEQELLAGRPEYQESGQQRPSPELVAQWNEYREWE